MRIQHGEFHRMLATVLVGIIGFYSTKPVAAVDVIDDPVQISDRLAQVLETSNALCWEMHVYHQQQSEFAASYRTGKEIWTRSRQMQDTLWPGPVETAAMVEKANESNRKFNQLEKSLSQWGDGDRASLAANDIRELHTVVQPGVGVNLPFVGIQVGSPSVVVEEEIPRLHRLRLHPNSPGSKRSLERKLDAVKLAVSYLLEDLKFSDQSAPLTPAPAPGETGPSPQAPRAATTPQTQPTPLPQSPGTSGSRPEPE